MRIKELSIKNFKSVIDVSLTDLPELVVFIGKNSSGKSNLIDALALMFLDFGKQLERDVGAQEYLFPSHLVREESLPEISVSLSLTPHEWEEVFPNDKADGKGFEDLELHLVKRIEPTGSGMQWKTHEVRVGDLSVVEGGQFVELDTTTLHEFTVDQSIRPVVPPAKRFLAQLGELLASSFEVIHTTESQRSWPDRFTERPTILDRAHIEELQRLSQSTGSQRQDWMKVAQGYEAMAPNEQRPVAVGSSIQMEEGTMSVPLGMTGEGSQATFRLVDQLERGSQILAIEEPETHLHPALIKKAGQLLTEATENGKQLFVCTHSPFLIDRASLDNLFVVRKGNNGTEVSPMCGTKDLRDTLYDIGMRPSDILFSDAILLVEGQSDEIFFNGLSKKLGVPLAECHAKIIQAGGMPRGRPKIEFWAEVGRDAGLPLYVILDKSADQEAQRAISRGHLQPERNLGTLCTSPWHSIIARKRLVERGEEMEQPTFADLEYAHKKRKTRREKFLERMDALLPWAEMEARIAPYYPKAGRGRRPYPLSVMLRVHCVQLFYNLSDPGMEDMLYEVEPVRRFVGLRLSEALPDETTILHFRHLLEKHRLGEGLLAEINAHLAGRGLRLRAGTVVDATIIAAPTSTKNREGSETRRCGR